MSEPGLGTHTAGAGTGGAAWSSLSVASVRGFSSMVALGVPVRTWLLVDEMGE